MDPRMLRAMLQLAGKKPDAHYPAESSVPENPDYEKVKDFLMWQAVAESGGNPNAYSTTSKGDTLAQGLTQLTPIAIKHAQNKGWVGNDFDPKNPEHAIELQIKMMDEAMEGNRGDLEMQLVKSAAGYNTGIANANLSMVGVDSTSMDWLPKLSKETRDYVGRVSGTDGTWRADHQAKFDTFKGKYGKYYTPEKLSGFYHKDEQ